MGMFTKQKTISRVLLLNIREISSNPYQPRSQFEPRALQELADSISQNGLLQPVTVREWENGYQLIGTPADGLQDAGHGTDSRDRKPGG